MSDFYKTRMGQQFYDRTMPSLVEQIERLAGAVGAANDPGFTELWDRALDLVEAAERASESGELPEATSAELSQTASLVRDALRETRRERR